MQRASGILMPVFSLPARYGIGTMGKAAYVWVDFLAKAKQQYWQVLPMGPTSYGDSPYQSLSAFAGNPYFIDIERLAEEGLLTGEECESHSCETGEDIDYAYLAEHRFALLKQAFLRFNDTASLQNFSDKHDNWLPDYALYMALKQDNKQREWRTWPLPFKNREAAALAQAQKRLADEIAFQIFMQYEFFKQWDELKAYAQEKGVSIIGDMPIYAAMDSADTWANREIFQMDEQGTPTGVAGCPPDVFSADGQLWGNPLYKWDVLKAQKYSWWIQRLAASFAMFDVVRIDHFRGLESYYAIPFGDKTARNGEWQEGPGEDFIAAIQSVFPNEKIIAEDLGLLTPKVKELLKASGYPGMKVLQFAFDPSGESDYLPHKYEKNCVVYTGTHDNDTMCGWLKHAPAEEIQFAREYLKIKEHTNEQWHFIEAAMTSAADLAIIPMQDYLGLGSEGRINTPSTLGGNWVWRMQKSEFSDELANQIAQLTKTTNRAE